MQNIAIIGVVVVLLIGAVVYFSNSPTDSELTPEPMDMQVTPMVEETETQPMAETEPMANDIVTTAVNTPSLSTLVTAVTAAELVETLQGPGPFTVFAPTNAAFDALPAGTLDTLLEPANQAQLQGVLTYHVVPGAILASDLTDGMEVETVNGQTITINVSAAGEVSINGSTAVTMADITTSNGVVHVIDNVLLPEAE